MSACFPHPHPPSFSCCTVALASLHTLWLREHNRIASTLKRMQVGDGSNDDLYHRARRILIAEHQSIVS